MLCCSLPVIAYCNSLPLNPNSALAFLFSLRPTPPLPSVTTLLVLHRNLADHIKPIVRHEGKPVEMRCTDEIVKRINTITPTHILISPNKSRASGGEKTEEDWIGTLLSRYCPGLEPDSLTPRNSHT